LLFTVLVAQGETKEEVRRRTKFLLDHHCDPCVCTAGGFYPLHLTLFSDNQALFELIADHILMSIQRGNNLDLIANGGCPFDHHLTSDSRRTYLQVACEKGKVDAVKYLLRKGANPTLQDSKRSSCLHLAIMFAAPSNALEIAEVLLREEANMGNHSVVRLDLIEQVGDAGCRALHLAIFTNNLSLMKYLIKCGADKEAPIEQNRKFPWKPE
jgi:ankyrin repeat protein